MKELVIKFIREQDHCFVGYFIREGKCYFHLNREPLLSQTEMSKSADYVSYQYDFLNQTFPSLPLVVYLRSSSNQVCFCLCSNAGKDEQTGKINLSVFPLTDISDISDYRIVEYCYLVSDEIFQNDFCYKIVKKLDNLIYHQKPFSRLKNISLRLEKILSPSC